MTLPDLLTNQNLPQGSKGEIRDLAPQSGLDLLPSGEPRIGQPGPGPAPAAAPAGPPMNFDGFDPFANREPSMPQFGQPEVNPLAELAAAAEMSGNEFLMAVMRRVQGGP